MSQKRKSGSDSNTISKESECENTELSSKKDGPKLDEPSKKHKVDKKTNDQRIVETILKKYKAKDLLAWMKDSSVITIKLSENLYTALVVMIENGISAVPIVDDKDECVGFVDRLDIVSSITRVLEVNGKIKQGPHRRSEEEATLIEENWIVDSLRAVDISNYSKRDPLANISEMESGWKAAQLLCKHHRVAVLHQNKLQGIISQSGLIEFLSEEEGVAFSKITSTVGDLFLPKRVHSIPPNISAAKAFLEMHEKKVSVLPIVDRTKGLVGVVSHSDLTLWNEWIAGGNILRFTNLEGLLDPVTTYLESSRTQHRAPNEHVRVYTCFLSTPLLEVIQSLLLHRVHQLFVVDGNSPNELLSVISYTDIFNYLCS